MLSNPIIEIKGGADEVDAAVVAIVLDRIAREEAAARQGRGAPKTGLPAWVRAVQPDDPRIPREQVWPD
ncbi:MAG TPA: hypothetical protein VE569_10995 [Acidimicrobiia bacterium]|nr:hypothetical protein [Acidimicrobiia bacterium]